MKILARMFLFCCLVLCAVFIICPISVFALSWDGSSTGGSGTVSPAGANGYAIRTSGDNCVGYRFSVVDSDGNNKVSKVIDVFRNTSYGNLGYTDGYKFSSKYNKKQLIAKQNSGFSTSKTTTNCRKEAGMSFSTALPAPSGMGTWQANENNINRVLSALGVGSVANMEYGDMVVVEPLYDVRLQNVYHSLTVTEIALYGKYILGSSSDGGASSTPESWGFISTYTNKNYPNSLYTPDGQGLWTAASSLSSRATFYNIINKGYGVGISYKETTKITYTIKFNGNGSTSGSTPSMTMTYGTAKKLNINCFVKDGSSFFGWNTKANGTGTGYTDGQSVQNLTSVNGATVTLYAQWQFIPKLDVDECFVYSGNKNDKTGLFGISTGSAFDDYEYRSDYPAIGDKVWFYVYFPCESETITVRQYVRNGGNWMTRDVSLSGSSNASQWFAVQFSGKYLTVDEATSCYTVQAKTDLLDSNGKVLKNGSVYTFYIPIKPVAYRSQVSARNYEGDTCAYNGMDGGSGKLYSGQHVKFTYKYTMDNTWSALEYLRGSLYSYDGSQWETVYIANSGYDVSKNALSFSKSSAVQLQSAIGTYTVPKTTASKLRFKLSTWWASDEAHTAETTWIELPVVPTDIEITEIRLVDVSTGAVLDPDALEAGQTVKVQYIYRNNTNAQVYFEGYRDDKTKIDAVYSIPANSTAYLNGYTFTVPNKRTFTIWGGVYLEGMPIYDTSYETDGTNNAMTLTCRVNYPLKLIPISQNADYREGTAVITSFWLNNTYTTAYTQTDNIAFKFNVYKGGTLIKTVTKTQVVVPGSEKNLLYFKWDVPAGLSGANVKISGEIIDGGISYSYTSANYTTTPNTLSATPDTQFEKKAPMGFSIPTTPSVSNGSAVWWEWVYSDGSFRKIYYGIGIAASSASVTPATGSTATESGGIWTMKSGYGLFLALPDGMASLSGYTTPNSSAYTSVQYAIAVFPEFSYSTANGNYRTLTLNAGSWIFSANGKYGNVHFTPLWYPDGSYIVSVRESDCWTPAGMIVRTVNANTIKISESAYDDWYIGR